MSNARPAWVVVDPDSRVHIVTPEERAASTERVIHQGWRRVARQGGLDAVVDWVLQVGDTHGWPLDERWVRQTFAELICEP